MIWNWMAKRMNGVRQVPWRTCCAVLERIKYGYATHLTHGENQMNKEKWTRLWYRNVLEG
jgi:hypothetical protein